MKCKSADFKENESEGTMMKSRIWNMIILYPVLLYADPLLSSAKIDFEKFDSVLIAQDEESPPPPPPAPPSENSNEAPAEAPDTPPLPPDEGPMSEESPPPPPQSSFSSSSKRSETGGKSKEEEDAAAAEKALRYKHPAMIPITEAERKSYCQKYNGKFVSFHSLILYVKDCKRYELTTEEGAKKSASGVNIIEVPSRVIAALGSGTDYASLVNKKKKCSDFNATYVTYNLKTYWVESCKLRLLPDYATIQHHRGRSEKAIVELQEFEFDLFKIGEPFVSILDKEALNVISPTIKSIPLEEVCKSLRKDYVTYLDSIYKIRRSKNGKTCWKEKLDAAELSRKQTLNLSSLQELNSNQSFSLPDYDVSIVSK